MAIRPKFKSPEVATLFAAYPKDIKAKLLFLREMIFDVAAEMKEVGELEETLKWGQPSYLTTTTKSGSLIRIDQIKNSHGNYAMYFHCQTTLVDTFSEMFPDKFCLVGNRSIVFKSTDRVPVKELRQCIKLALTYHLRKKQK